MTARARGGFTMITVLWVLTVASLMATAAALTGRNAVNATRNRMQLERAAWMARGCVERIQSAIDARLGAAVSYEDAAVTWRMLDRAVLPVAQFDRETCVASLDAAGSRLDVNTAPDETIENLSRAMGHEADAAHLVDALADWRDSDDVVRPFGAERDWYIAAHRDLPRNGPLADIRELARVRGFENIQAFDSVLTTESGRISLATASATVLMSVPGFTRETVDRIIALREAGTPIADLISILGSLSRPSSEALLARYADVVRVTTPDPEAWLLTVRATTGRPAGVVALTRRLVRAGKRAVVASTKSDQ